MTDSTADKPTLAMSARDWMLRAKETLDARTREEDDAQLVDAFDDICNAIEAYDQAAQPVGVPPEAVPVAKGGSLFLPEGNWVIPTGPFSMRVVDARMAYGWNECRKEMLATPPAQDVREHWRPMETAPRDSTMLRLLVEFSEHATEDSPDPSPTIGFNSFDDNGEEDWKFAGWCWCHDHFTQGEGTPVGWLPMLAEKGDA